ncbi:MAG: hypothetical protein EOO38_01680 [Cytophagaceae bacterium]|nr:MAG: hypothetical protein EOO38_01680 [Cytophagaceae bacterium]
MLQHKLLLSVASDLPQTHIAPAKKVVAPKTPRVSKVTKIHAYKLVLISEIGWFTQLNERNEKLVDLTPGSFQKLSGKDKARVAKIVMRAKLIEVLKVELDEVNKMIAAAK